MTTTYHYHPLPYFILYPKNLGPQLHRVLRVRTPAMEGPDPCHGRPKNAWGTKNCWKMLGRVVLPAEIHRSSARWNRLRIPIAGVSLGWRTSQAGSTLQCRTSGDCSEGGWILFSISKGSLPIDNGAASPKSGLSGWGRMSLGRISQEPFQPGHHLGGSVENYSYLG